MGALAGGERARSSALTPYQTGVQGEWSLAQSWHNGEPDHHARSRSLFRLSRTQLL